MTSAIEAARYLILLAGNDPNSEDMTPLRLQKLLYYAQGWSLALRDASLFTDKIQAWPWGPVVPSVYRAYRDYARKGIPASTVGNHTVRKDDRELIDAVWRAYKGFSASRLSDMTHQEAPWKDARGVLPADSPSTRELTISALKKHFKALAKK